MGSDAEAVFNLEKHQRRSEPACLQELQLTAAAEQPLMHRQRIPVKAHSVALSRYDL